MTGSVSLPLGEKVYIYFVVFVQHPTLKHRTSDVLHLGSGSAVSPFHLESKLLKNADSVQHMEKCMTAQFRESVCS